MMRAMILAAGKGERMRPLTDTTPKPMLRIKGKPLLQYQIERLAAAGIKDIVINHSIHGDQIEKYFSNGHRFNVNIVYSAEGQTPLETGGGIFKALSLLGDAPFLVVNGDIWTDYPFKQLTDIAIKSAHLVLVDNPDHHPEGDYYLDGNRVSKVNGSKRFTFSGIAVYRPEFFSNCTPGVFALGPLLNVAVENQKVTGEYYQGFWCDIGTPSRLNELNNM